MDYIINLLYTVLQIVANDKIISHIVIVRVGLITPGYPRTHLISYIIHLFIHSDENKAKMASYSFHFQVHSFEKVLLNTSEKTIKTPYRLTDISLNETLHCIFSCFIYVLIIIIIITVIIFVLSTDN